MNEHKRQGVLDVMNTTLQKQLEKCDLSELNTAKNYIDTLIKKRKKDARSNLLSKLKNLVEEEGFTLDELVNPGGKGIKIPKKTFRPKYCNPDDSNQTWTGLGRKPNWVRNNLDNGKTLDDLRIPE